MQFSYQTVKELASMCEYHYRKGVYEATMEPDSVEAQKYAADDDGYMTIRRFRKAHFAG